MRTRLLLLLFVFAVAAPAQVRQSRSALRSAPQDRLAPSPQAQESLRATVHAVEAGLRTSSTAPLSLPLASSVQLALPDLGRGDYSANQALQLLSGFLTRHPAQTATIDRVEAAVASPYASGTIVVSGDGRDTLRLYLSFAAVESRWLITHLSLY